MKLSNAQYETLHEAYLYYKRSVTGGWFYPSRYELAEVYTTTPTCKALCRKGLLEYRVGLPAIGKYPEALEFRITEDGMKQVVA